MFYHFKHKKFSLTHENPWHQNQHTVTNGGCPVHANVTVTLTENIMAKTDLKCYYSHTDF